MAVSIDEGLRFIYENVKKKSTKYLPLEDAVGTILAQDIVAKYDLPRYNNSAMDGYGVKIADNSKCVNIQAYLLAGDNSENLVLNKGYAIKIMTGAKIPLGVEAIVPVEDVQVCDLGILLPKNITLNKHIRFCGEDIKKGKLLLEKGNILHAHQITLLASQGITHIQVYKKPKVTIFSSGDEIKMHFELLEQTQFYNTNAPTFVARLKELGCEVDFIGSAKDNIEDFKFYIENALESDLIITSGGVSVGDADFTKEAFRCFGHKIFFEKVNIKPGKPTTFGKIGSTYILNLPGNPLAAALNFEIFGQSILLALSGNIQKYIQPIFAKMSRDYVVKKGKFSVIPGLFDGEYFTPIENFSPGMISPLAQANSYIIVHPDCENLNLDQKVKVISIHFSFSTTKQVSLITV